MLKYRLNIDDEWKLGTPICFFLIGLYLRNATVEMTFLSDNAKNIFSVSIQMHYMCAVPACEVWKSMSDPLELE